MAYQDYYQQLQQQQGGNVWDWSGSQAASNWGSPVAQGLQNTGSAYQYGTSGYDPNALGNKGFFMPSGMGTSGSQTYAQGSPVSSALQQYYGGAGAGGTGTSAISSMMGAGAGTQDLATQLALMNAQYGLQQQGQQAKMTSAQSVAKQLGLDPSTASSIAEQMSSVQDLTTQRESEGAMQAIRNQLARSGMGISSEGDKLQADVLGTTAAQTRSNRTMAEIQMKQYMMSALAQLLGRAI